MEQQDTASTSASFSCGSSISQHNYHDDYYTCSPLLSRQAQQIMDQPLYPIMGRPSDILNDYIVLPTVLGTGHYGTVRECLHRQTRQA